MAGSKEKPAVDGGGAINADTAARLIMLSRPRFYALAKAGWFKPVTRGRFNLVEVVQGHIRALKDETARQSRTKTESELRDVRRRREELRLAQDEKKVMDVTEAKEMAAELTGRFIETLNGLPTLIAAGDQGERTRIEGIIDKAKKRLSTDLAKIARAAGVGGDAPGAAGPGDAKRVGGKK